MNAQVWLKNIPAAVTICDTSGIILEMNDAARKLFSNEGGGKLLGTNVLDCHPEPARTKLSQLLANRQKNVYTIEKSGVKKLVYQAPWYNGEKYGGFVEIVLAIPFELPHFLRDRG
jgi:sensor histidine kinase regulating citrate/malate metabolism